ncbi:hypothetical protein SLITO_v1c04140 [Spiroplasma litorale]|uniref:Uncharacterized protein n=1 Tax=Spiroplasma litorale TaxID=216942 RepID=A0A0K1W1T6_9MOLU|nr:hypothetical protein [Spiroplasma litorale]AKX34067.1 hypothetical protein SLITO_v1c04140 [Spiroplasma litorale]
MDIKLLEDFISKKGIYKLFNKALLKDFLTINENDIFFEDKVIECSKNYAEKTLSKIKKTINIKIEISELMDMLSFEFYSDTEFLVKKINNEDEIKSFIVSVIKGKEKNINNIYLEGSARVWLLKKIDLSKEIVNRNIKNLSSNIFLSKESKIINELYNINKLSYDKKYVTVDIIDSTNKIAKIRPCNGFNGPYYLNEEIIVNF